jgi:hypothetical protein
MPNAILDPTGGAQAGRAEQSAEPTAEPGLAPRRADLRGATVGLLENTKHNAALFLDELGRLLVDRYGAAGVLARTKTNFAQPVEEGLRKEMAGGCDVVITGVGDCGSCSAAAVMDGVEFETNGTPVAVICSDAFRGSADAIAGLRGLPGYRYVTTPHPVAVLTPAEVRARAERALPEVVSLLVADSAGAESTGAGAGDDNGADKGSP